MKKTLLIMLAVLLLFSFVSCKDSSDEIIAVYEEYKTTDKIMTDVYRLIYYDTGSGDTTVNYTVDVTKMSNEDLVDLFEKIGIEQTPTEIKSVSGTVEGTRGSGKVDVEYKNIVITYTADGIKDPQTFTISGTWVDKPETSDEIWSHDYSFKLNDKEYSLSYSKNGADKYTRAIVNGKNVELRLLNSRIENAT